MKAIKKDILLIGEIWHFAGDFLEGDEWDSVMNYQFYHSVLDLISSETLCPSTFMENLNFVKGNLNRCLEGYLWNFIDTHDTARFIHSVHNDIKKQMLAASLQLLLPGMPMIYYGDEVLLKGGSDPDCRRGMLWDKNRQNKEVFHYYQTLIQIRHEYPVLTEGTITEQYTDDKKGLIYISRHLNIQNIILIFHTQKGTVNLPQLKGMRNLIHNQIFSGNLEDYETVVLVK